MHSSSRLQSLAITTRWVRSLEAEPSVLSRLEHTRSLECHAPSRSLRSPVSLWLRCTRIWCVMNLRCLRQLTIHTSLASSNWWRIIGTITSSWSLCLEEIFSTWFTRRGTSLRLRQLRWWNSSYCLLTSCTRSKSHIEILSLRISSARRPTMAQFPSSWLTLDSPPHSARIRRWPCLLVRHFIWHLSFAQRLPTTRKLMYGPRESFSTSSSLVSLHSLANPKNKSMRSSKGKSQTTRTNSWRVARQILWISLRDASRRSLQRERPSLSYSSIHGCRWLRIAQLTTLCSWTSVQTWLPSERPPYSSLESSPSLPTFKFSPTSWRTWRQCLLA